MPCRTSHSSLVISPGDVEPLELSAAQLREVTLGHLVNWIVGAAATPDAPGPRGRSLGRSRRRSELLQRVTALTPPGLLAIVTSRTPPAWVHEVGFELLALVPTLPRRRTHRSPRRSLAGSSPRELVDEIARRSDGMPLFVEQLADSMSGADARIPGRRRSIPMQAHRTAPSPSRRDRRRRSGSLSWRRRSVASSSRRCSQPSSTAAAEGRLEPFDRPVTEHLARLVDSHIVEPDPIDERLLRFRHALVGEAAYESQLLAERPERHEVLARLLLDQGDDGGRALGSGGGGAATSSTPDRRRGDRPVPRRRCRGTRPSGAFAEVTASIGRAETLLAAAPDGAAPGLELAIRMNRGLAVSSAAGYAAQAVIDDFGRAVELCEQLRDEDVRRCRVCCARCSGSGRTTAPPADLATAASISDSMEQQLRTGADACRAAELPRLPGRRAVLRGRARRGAEQHLTLAVELFADDDIDLSTGRCPH